MPRPSSRPTVRLGHVLVQRKEFVEVSDVENYKRCRVQLHARGIVLRDTVSGAEVKTKRQQVCRPGEFLVAEIDAKLGGFGIVPPDLDGSIVSSHYFLFALNRSLLEPRFLDYYIRTPGFQEQVKAQGSTNYAAVRPEDVLDYTIPLPPLAEQRRIVPRIQELAGCVDGARALRLQTVAEVDALLAVARRTLFCGCDSQIVALEDGCTAIIDNLHSNPRLSEAGIPCVRSPDVGYGTLDLDGAQRTDEDEYRRRTVRGEPHADDIVLVREGGGTGKCALVSRGQRFSLGQRVMMLRPDRERLLPRFFLHQLLSPLVQDQIAPLCKGSASPHLNIGSLRRFSLRLPPLPEQRRIAGQLDALQRELDGLKRLHVETARELDALLPAILDKAFKGEL